MRRCILDKCSGGTELLIIIFLLITATAIPGRAESIWIEGENPSRSEATRHPWYNKVKKNSLSGKNWLSHFNKQKEGTAEYDFRVSDTGHYLFWLRANPTKSSISYNLDNSGWKIIDMSRDCRGTINIAADNKPDLRFIAWKKICRVKLKKGRHTVKFLFNSAAQNHGAVDCFVFDNTGFVPSGTLKPEEINTAEPTPSGWFPVVFDDDRFSERSLIDMSHLIHAPAGKYGFLKTRNEHLVFEKQNKPVKFWGCGANLNMSHTREQMIQRIRYLKKHGVNMVRQHTVLSATGLLKNDRFDAGRLKKFDMWCAELKKHGLYMTWSVFYPHHGPFIQKEDGYGLFEELKKNNKGVGNAGGLVNIFRGLQDIQLKYIKALLSHKNPYTNLRYADDPALAVLEIQNEDCVFFHVPLNDLRDPEKLPEHSKRFRRMFGTWIKKQYRTESALRKAWGELRNKDSWNSGEFETMGAYHLGKDGPLYEFKGQTRRAGDFIKFLTDLQRSFYERREKEMRQLGFKGVTVTTAWKAGGASADPANIYCDTACDMIDRHNYFGGGDGGHNIRQGKVNSESHLSKPGSGLLASGMYQVDNMPFALSEWSQLPPNQWKLEAAPLLAFYGYGLQGWDVSCHFLNSRARIGSGWPNLSSYVTDTPHYIGQFPALAFALYKGHITEAPVIAARRLNIKDLFHGVDALRQDLTGGINTDIKQLKGNPDTPAELLAVGKVTVSFNGDRSQTTNTGNYIDRNRKIVKSVTGELTWHYGRGTVILHGQKTQAVIGRTEGINITLPGVYARINTPFVSLIFTPLDNQPLVSSKSILVTAMGRDRQKGTEYSRDGNQLTSLGSAPLMMEPVEAAIKLKGKPPRAVRVLDVYGVPSGKSVELNNDGSFIINGLYQTYYYHIIR